MRQPVPAACQRPATDRIRLPRASVMTHIRTIQSVFAAFLHASGLFLLRAGCCWLLLAGCVYAQQPDRAIATGSNLDYAYSNLPTQPVGPDDLLALSVYDSPELTRTVRVDANGNIRLPMLKDPIPVRGMVPSQVESTIAKSLTKGKVLVDPIVTVTIVEYQSRPVNVVGAVKNPLVFQATRPIPLLDAIARAGGMREDAGSDIVVSRQVMQRRKTGQDHANDTGAETDRQCRSQRQRDAAWGRGSSGTGGAQDLRGWERQEAGSVPGTQ